MTARADACWDPPPPAPGQPARRQGAVREACANAPPAGTVLIGGRICRRYGCTDLDCAE